MAKKYPLKILQKSPKNPPKIPQMPPKKKINK